LRYIVTADARHEGSIIGGQVLVTVSRHQINLKTDETLRTISGKKYLIGLGFIKLAPCYLLHSYVYGVE
jgi:hypothetical protein